MRAMAAYEKRNGIDIIYNHRKNVDHVQPQ